MPESCGPIDGFEALGPVGDFHSSLGSPRAARDSGMRC